MELIVLTLALMSALTTAIAGLVTALVWGGPRFIATVMCSISARKDPEVHKRDLQTLRSLTREKPPKK